MTRRELLTSLLIPAAVGCAAEAVAAQAARHRTVRRAAPGPGQLARVGVSSWSFHNSFPATREATAPASDERLALLDFPEMIADRYKVHNLEFVAPHFASTEPSYLSELKSNLTRVHSRLVNIPVDIRELEAGGGLSDPTTTVRDPAIAACKKWIDIARQVGARSVRCDPGALDPANLSVTIDSFRQLAAYGRAKGIAVLIENHDAVGSTHPEALVSVFRTVGGNFVGALPDFGNFPDDATRLRALPMLFQYARTICHAKGLNIDAGGNETAFNFQQCVEIAKKGGFKGIYSIEYEGTGDAHQGVQGVVNELLRYL